MKVIGVLLALLCAAGQVALAEPPRDEKGIPVFPGAALIAEERAPADSARGTGPQASFTLTRTYESKASADEVAGFFVTRLGAKPEEESSDPAPARIWQASGVDCMVAFYDRAFGEENGAAVKAGFAKRTQPSWAGGLISMGLFRWGSQAPNGDTYSFTLMITDASIVPGQPPAYSQKTSIALSVIMVNTVIAAQQQEQAAARSADAADAMVKGLNRQDPEKVAIVDAMRADPPSDRELTDLVKKEFGVRLYPKMRLDLRAMEIYTYDLWGGLGGYWFVSHDLPDKIVEFYEKATGNRQYMGALDPTHYIDITGRDGVRTGCIAIYQGTTSLLPHEEQEDADPNEVWLVSTVGFFKKGPRHEEQGGR